MTICKVLNDRNCVFNGSNIKFSVPSDYNNFNTETGLDNEAIDITLLSLEKQNIVSVVPNTYNSCYILTDKELWVLFGHTPSSIDIRSIARTQTVLSEHQALVDKVESIESQSDKYKKALEISEKFIKTVEDGEQLDDFGIREEATKALKEITDILKD